MTSCFFFIVLIKEIFQVKKSLIEHSTKKILLIQKVTYECFAKLQSYLGGIHHFRSEKRTGAEMPHAIVSGIVAGEAPISYWPFFPASLETVPKVFAKLNASSFFLSLKWRQGSAE